MTDLFLNAGFGEPIGDKPLDEIANMGFVGVRQDYVRRRGRQLVQEFAAHNDIRPIFLIGGGKTKSNPDAIERAASECAHYCHRYQLFERPRKPIFEIINEPNLSPYYADHPIREFALAVNRSFIAVRSYDHDALVFAGGVSNTDETSLNYLERAVFYMHESIGIAFHSYHTTAPPEEPHEPFASREAEMQRLLSITRDRFLALTELGRHTAPQKRGFWCFSKKYQETDADVAQYLMGNQVLCQVHGLDCRVPASGRPKS